MDKRLKKDKEMVKYMENMFNMSSTNFTLNKKNPSIPVRNREGNSRVQMMGRKKWEKNGGVPNYGGGGRRIK